MISNTTNDNRYEGYVSASLTKFSQQNSAVEDYDYDNPYWTPADKKVELLSQFRKLKIQEILPENIELVWQCIFIMHAYMHTISCIAKIIAPFTDQIDTFIY